VSSGEQLQLILAFPVVLLILALVIATYAAVAANRRR
jgi:hypothetical protein